MELGTGAITAALVGVIIVLNKVIEWLMGKKKNGNGHVPAKLPEQQCEELHQCFLYLTEHKVQMEYLRGDIRSIQDSQKGIDNRISELITSQQRVIDRIGDLINSMDQLLRRS